VSIDGWAHHYFDDPKCHMPAVKSLAAQGVRVKRMETSFPTVTWTNHTTLVTGVHPGRHGVLANEYYDRKERKKVPLIPDPIFNKDEIVKTPTIYDAAKAAGLTTAAVIWPASRGAKTLDWTVPDVFEQELFEKYGTPQLLEEARALGIPIEKQMEWCKLGNAGKAQRDYLYTQLATHIIRTKKPNFLALHLVSLDSFEHAHGRQVPEAYWAANDSDNRVADLIRACEEAGIRDKTTFIITTDHGFVTYTKSINANAALKKDGFVKSVLGKSLAPDSKVFAMAEGGCCFVYVLDEANRDSILAEITPKLAKLEGVSGTVEAKDFVEVVIHALRAEAGVFREGVVLSDPLKHGLHAGVVLVETSVDEAEHAGVADAAVAAQSGAAIGRLRLAAACLAGAVDEAAGVFCIGADPGGFIRLGAVLAVLHKLDGGGEVELRFVFTGVAFISKESLGVVERLQGEVGVREIGVRGDARLRCAVADAAVEGIVQLALFIEVVLLADDEATRGKQRWFAFLAWHQHERGERERGVVVGAGLHIDATVGLHILHEKGDALLDFGGQWITGLAFGSEQDAGDGERGEGHGLGIAPLAGFGVLLRLEEGESAIIGKADFLLQRFVPRRLRGGLGKDDLRRGEEEGECGGFHG
jgi:predicted AlkP superfamily pyrophosphatase or phosphodiesterase